MPSSSAFSRLQSVPESFRTPGKKQGVAIKQVTSVDVADLAGVSIAAVSRAFTPGASISPATKERVIDAADKLGYHPNVIARSLNRRRSNLIGLLMSGWNNFGYVDILRSFCEKLEAQGYEVILKSVLERDRIEDCVRQLLQYQVAAIAVVSEVLPAATVSECARRSVPVVLVNRIGRGTGTSAVSLDGAQLGRRIADFFLKRGHRRIALLRGRDDIDFLDDTMAAIAGRVAESGRCKVTASLSGVLGYEAGRRCIAELSERQAKPDAVFCTADDTAVGVLDGARVDLGLRVPQDLSVIGNGSRAFASWAGHELTTVDYPSNEVIDDCLKILLPRLENPDLEPEVKLLKADLVVRSSTRDIPGGVPS